MPLFFEHCIKYILKGDGICHPPVLAAARKASAFGLPAAVCMSTCNSDMPCCTILIFIVPAVTGITQHIGILFRRSHRITASASTSLRGKASATGFRLCFRLNAFYMDIISFTAIVTIIRTIDNITIQLSHDYIPPASGFKNSMP